MSYRFFFLNGFDTVVVYSQSTDPQTSLVLEQPSSDAPVFSY